MRKKINSTVLYSLCVALFVFSILAVGPARAQDASEKYADIVGSYEFDTGGQAMVLVVYIEGEKLMGGPEGQTAVEMVPVEGKELTFEVEAPTGVFTLTFSKDDSGKIAKCLVSGNGMELEGIKVKK